MDADPESRRVLIYRGRMDAASESFIRAQARAMRRWTPLLVAIRQPRSGEAFLSATLSSGRVASDGLFRLARWAWWADPGSMARVRPLAPALVHAHFGTGGVDIWPVARKLGVPLVVTLHGSDILRSEEWWRRGGGGLRRRAYPARLRQLAAEPSVSFVAVSDVVRDAAIARGIPASKVKRCYVGVDTAFFAPATPAVQDRPQRILYVGRLVENKGPHVLLEAFSHIAQRLPKAEVVLAGDGPMRLDLERLAHLRGLRATFLGEVTQAQVREELGKARVLCHPSLTVASGAAEGFGLALLEAQSAGVPVVSSARSGAAEGMIDGVTGYRFREGDSRQAAELIARLLVDDAASAAFSSAGRKFVVDSFDLGACTARLEDAYDDAMRTCHAHRTSLPHV